MEKAVIEYRFPSMAALRAAVLVDWAVQKAGFEIGDEEGYYIHWEYVVSSVDQLSSAGMMSLDNYLHEKEDGLCWLRVNPAEEEYFDVAFCLNTHCSGVAAWVAPRHGWIRAELVFMAVFAHDGEGNVTARYVCSWKGRDEEQSS